MADLGTIAFIGAGNMATALIQGLIGAEVTPATDIVATDLRADSLSMLAERYGIRTCADNGTAVASARVVMLCVKPQQLAAVLQAVAPTLPPQALLISIAAGVPTAVIEGLLKPGTRVVRAMPNTPALVQAGATGLCAGAKATPEDLAVAGSLFESVGATVVVEETLIDAVTGVSGSGPAYVFRFVEALIAAGTAVGLSHDAARTLATQTLFGAAKLLEQSGEEPAVLRERVTSKGGTTAAGLSALDRAGFAAAIQACVTAATSRGRELGEEARRAAQDD